MNQDMSEPINPYSPPNSDPVSESFDINRPASSRCMAVISFIVSGVICWAHYEIIKESGLSRAVATYADYPLFTVISVILLVTPALMFRKKPGWPGYLLGGLSSFALAGYFVWRTIHQVSNWSGGVSVGYLLVGIAFALPFVVLFVRFVFGMPNRRFHGIELRRVRSETVKQLPTSEG
jgi:hypothetical protein